MASFFSKVLIWRAPRLQHSIELEAFPTLKNLGLSIYLFLDKGVNPLPTKNLIKHLFLGPRRESLQETLFPKTTDLRCHNL